MTSSQSDSQQWILLSDPSDRRSPELQDFLSLHEYPEPQGSQEDLRYPSLPCHQEVLLSPVDQAGLALLSDPAHLALPAVHLTIFRVREGGEINTGVSYQNHPGQVGLAGQGILWVLEVLQVPGCPRVRPKVTDRLILLSLTEVFR